MMRAAHCDTATARILVGNKCDLEEIRGVSVEQGKCLAEQEGLFFIETSALDSTNVVAAFDIVTREIYKNVCRKVDCSQDYKPDLSAHRINIAALALANERKSKYACCST